MGGFSQALPLAIIVAIAWGHIENDHWSVWNPPAVQEWKQKLAVPEAWRPGLIVQEKWHKDPGDDNIWTGNTTLEETQHGYLATEERSGRLSFFPSSDRLNC